MKRTSAAQAHQPAQPHVTRSLPSLLSFVDLFSGAGGFSRGLLDSGRYTHLLGVDFEPDAIATYRENIGDGWCANLRHKRVLDGLPACHVLIGSPPCQGFSVAGQKRGERDERNGWPLFFLALRRLRPQAFIAENVDRLTHKPCQPYFTKLLACAERLGYTVQWKVLDAADYGVPQHRRRVFLVGFRSPACASAFSWPLPTHTPFPGLWTQRWASAADALLPRLAGRAPDPKGLPNWLRRHEDAITTTDERTLIRGMGSTRGQDGQYLVKGANGSQASAPVNGGEGRHTAALYDGHKYQQWQVQRKERGYGDGGANWQSLYLPSFAITATIHGRHRVKIGNDVWKLDCGDLAALQGFPDAYHWQGRTVTSLSRQIGNAVCPPVARALGAAVALALCTAGAGERVA